MKYPPLKIFIPSMLFSILLVSFSVDFATAEENLIPSWIKNTAGFWVDGEIEDSVFLDMIKFLIENDVIILENKDVISDENLSATIIIPSGNVDLSNTAFYKPLNLEISPGTVVSWVNQDKVPHTVQSQDESGNIIGSFHSSIIETGETFEFTFEEEGVFNYYCSFHPWRIGLVTVK